MTSEMHFMHAHEIQARIQQRGVSMHEVHLDLYTSYACQAAVCCSACVFTFFLKLGRPCSLVCFLLENQGATIEKRASILSETMMETHVADSLY